MTLQVERQREYRQRERARVIFPHGENKRKRLLHSREPHRESVSGWLGFSFGFGSTLLRTTEQNRVRLIERRGARLHSISDRPTKLDGYPSYRILCTRYNSPSPRAGRTGLRNKGLHLDQLPAITRLASFALCNRNPAANRHSFTMPVKHTSATLRRQFGLG